MYFNRKQWNRKGKIEGKNPNDKLYITRCIPIRLFSAVFCINGCSKATFRDGKHSPACESIEIRSNWLKKKSHEKSKSFNKVSHQPINYLFNRSPKHSQFESTPSSDASTLGRPHSIHFTRKARHATVCGLPEHNLWRINDSCCGWTFFVCAD